MKNMSDWGAVQPTFFGNLPSWDEIEQTVFARLQQQGVRLENLPPIDDIHLETLHGLVSDQWLSHSLIDNFFRLVSTRDISFLSSTALDMAEQSWPNDWTSLDILKNWPGLAVKTLIFFPVLLTGHCVLFAFSKVDRKLHFYDSLSRKIPSRNTNPNEISTKIIEILRLMGYGDVASVVQNTPQQGPNPRECGVYVCAIAEAIVRVNSPEISRDLSGFNPTLSRVVMAYLFLARSNSVLLENVGGATSDDVVIDTVTTMRTRPIRSVRQEPYPSRPGPSSGNRPVQSVPKPVAGGSGPGPNVPPYVQSVDKDGPVKKILQELHSRCQVASCSYAAKGP